MVSSPQTTVTSLVTFELYAVLVMSTEHDLTWVLDVYFESLPNL